MTFRRIMLLGALATSMLLATGTSSRANYTYSTILSITSVTGTNSGGTINNSPTPAGATYSVTANGGTTSITMIDALNTNGGTGYNGPLIGVNTGALVLASTASSAVAFTVTYTETVVITNPVNSSTGNFTITGTMVFTGVTSASGSTTNTFGPSNMLLQTNPNIGGSSFTVSFGTGADHFSGPTVNGTTGSISADINPIPEPAGLALLGTGLVGILGLGLSRRKRS